MSKPGNHFVFQTDTQDMEAEYISYSFAWIECMILFDQLSSV